MRRGDDGDPRGAEDQALVFRLRALVSAQRILDAQLEAASRPPRNELQVQRLRRLRAYIRDSIAALERRIEQGGVASLEVAPGRHSSAPSERAPPVLAGIPLSDD